VNDDRLPGQAEDYLIDLDRALDQLPVEDRAAIVADVTDHIRAQLARGEGIEQVLADLGGPQEVAAAAFDRPVTERIALAPEKWWTPTRVAQLIAAALFAAAGLLIRSGPLGTAVTEEATPHRRVLHAVQNTTLANDVGWYAVMAFAAVPLLLAIVPMLLGGTAHRILTIAAAVLAFLFCMLTLASIGFFFLPGVLALVAAAVPLALRSRQTRSAIYHEHPAAGDQRQGVADQ